MTWRRVMRYYDADAIPADLGYAMDYLEDQGYRFFEDFGVKTALDLAVDVFLLRTELEVGGDALRGAL